MQKLSELSTRSVNDFLEQFYQYFENGYKFEEFLKVYLEKIGLDEVSVTQRSADGGIDLKAIRHGVDELSDRDITEYYIQAKRNKPGTKIPIEKVRALRGVIPSGAKGIFITTADFSSKTEEFVRDDLTRPIILLNGTELIRSCIDHEIGFIYTPVFSRDVMDSLMNRGEELSSDGKRYENGSLYVSVEKTITINDIRARILRIPRVVKEMMNEKSHTVVIDFEGYGKKELKIDKTGTYFGGITEVYKHFGLITRAGTFETADVLWMYFEDGNIKAVFHRNRSV